ncbi:flagellar hook capping protein [Sphingobium phenoxybenzoativorans]|uniref:Basal-body rod modification protein FlgD n=1 Tax=Sphingobium phenoxybenzoativorans TaxID=1592790 RepID=A0A975K9C7_9SPHN|nr:flagellar hook capping FlgD N-terminal domain-containing protein [Sphingobium phenoxybenzoativorans]QUT05842.1 flagellar hook capping protein [Sphingobium phenoxybenzoativorans]
MTVAATDAAGLTTYNSTKTVGTGKSEMGQADFLRLLTTQMQTQDPFQPMDNSQMVTQMATITNSTGIAEMNQTLAGIKEQLSGTRLGDAASWIGKSMLVKSNIAAPDAAGQYAGVLELPADADNVTVQLQDGSGNVVKTLDLGAQKAGEVNFYWDGKDDAGNTVGTQALQVKVNGASPTAVATWATIAAVQSPADGSSSSLITPLGTYKPTDAIRLG